jgi:hypothetical protein
MSGCVGNGMLIRLYPDGQRMKARFEISQEEFQGRKKRRIEEMRKPARTCLLNAFSSPATGC